MHTIYCFNNGGSRESLSALALCDDGRLLAHHLCSHECFMMHDLGRYSDAYDKALGGGNWRLVWVEDPRTHDGLQAAYALNQRLATA